MTTKTAASYLSSSSSSSFSSSSSPTSRLWSYDVFLSFRGEDTRRNFTDHLYAALNGKGIFTFRDEEELERGKPISPKLLKAIEESRYVIVILSSNYANSSWCLDELSKTMESRKVIGQTVLPVFYHVDPSEVRKQTGNFGNAFSKHEEVFKDNLEKVKRWRAALFEVSNLSGWHLQDGYEAKAIQDITQNIFTELNQTILSVSQDLVGMDSRISKLLSYLHIGFHDVRIIGIWGMGGIGKTTIAQVVSERIRGQFDGYSFLMNIREEIEKQGAVHLQKQLLSDLLKSEANIQNIHMGRNIIRHRLRMKRVLIILDDVDQLEQLEALCGRSWFGSGSRVIITSRDEHLLTTFGVDTVYQVETLTDAEALQLFSWKAFKKDQVGEDFLELSKNVVNYVRGLPLALKVLGSFLCGRNKKEWSSALDRLKENPERKITDVLKVSFDGLLETEKNIFLDIACFFKGESKDHVTRILNTGDFYPDIGIPVLVEKSLVTISFGKLWMHDLIQELGWEIVRQECREEPGKRSRLWLPKDIIPLLVNNEGTSAVQGIFLNLPKEQQVHLNVDPFSKMCKLRLLKIRNVHFSGNVKYLSNELQLLDWPACPLNSLSNFQSDKLVILNICSSRIKQLWSGHKCWSTLQFVNLCHSEHMISTPNFTEVPNLEFLVLQGCTRLVEVHPSIGVLKKLILLNMRNCKSVVSLPRFITLESLETLILSACSRLKKFPEIEGNMKSLLQLHLDGTAIEELPLSIERCTGLTLLNLGDCKNLSVLPSTIQYLTSLKRLILTGCSELADIPENLSCLEFLEQLDISGTAVRDASSIVGMKTLKALSFQGCKDLPSKSWHSIFDSWWWRRKIHVPMSLLLPYSLSGFSSLEFLNLSDCNLVEATFPTDIGSLFSLTELILSNNSFVHLPDSLSQLSKLEFLDLRNCRRLQSLPKKLPLSVQHVNAKNCTSLMDFPNQFKVWASDVSGITTINSLNIASKNLHASDYDTFRSYTGQRGMISLRAGPSHCQECEPCVDQLSLPIQVFQKDLELMDYKSYDMGVIWQGNEIPDWYSNISNGKFIEIPLPPNLKDDQKWMGVAAVCLLKAHPAVSDFESDYFFKCTVGTHEFQLRPYYDASNVRSRSHVLFLIYEPCRNFPEGLNKSSAMAAKFETSNECMEVQTCGIRLVYEHDVEGFIQTFPPFTPKPPCRCRQCSDGGQNKIPLFSPKPPHIIPSHHDSNLNEDIDEATFRSGWFNRVDKVLRWEKLVPSSKEGSIILMRRNAESVLRRYLAGLNQDFKHYDFFVSGSPVWFNPEVGSSVSMELPQNLHKSSKKWMGFAICASLALDHQCMVKEDCHVTCQLRMDKVRCINMSVHFSSKESAGNKQKLLVFYLPRAICLGWFPNISSTKICTSIRATNSPGIEVQICGFRILYQQDLQGFVQTITRCMLRSSNTPFEFYNDLVVKDWIGLIALRSPKRELRTVELNDFRLKDWSMDLFACLFPNVEIPKWFMDLNKGGFARIQLPPNLFDDDNWMGIAVCVSASIHEHPTIILNTPNSASTDDYNLFCCIDTNIAGTAQCFTMNTPKTMWSHACDFTGFLYIPRARFSDSLNQCNQVGTLVGSKASLGLHECALRLVFNKDVEELVKTLDLCASAANCPHCDQEKKRLIDQ